jgi:uncharacterized integral membrane protein
MTPPSDDWTRPDPPDRELPLPGPPAKEPPPVEELPPPAPPVEESPPPPAPAGTGFTRISAAWLGVWAGLVVVILLIIFIGQNTAKVQITFLWMHGLIPTALALLIAGVGGAVVAMAVAAARIVQLRRLVRRRR